MDGMGVEPKSFSPFSHRHGYFFSTFLDVVVGVAFSLAE